MKDSIEKLGMPTVIFHWLIALSIIGMIAFGLYLEELPRSPDKGRLMGLHKSIGVLILFVALLRVFWRTRNGFPSPLSKVDVWQEKAARIAHLLLIAASVMMPVSGVLMSIGGGRAVSVFGVELISALEKNDVLSDFGHLLHGAIANLLIVLVILHVGAACKHQFFDKDGTLTRMFGKRVALSRDLD